MKQLSKSIALLMVFVLGAWAFDYASRPAVKSHAVYPMPVQSVNTPQVATHSVDPAMIAVEMPR